MEKPDSARSTKASLYAARASTPFAHVKLNIGTAISPQLNNSRRQRHGLSALQHSQQNKVSDASPEYFVDKLMTEILHELKQPLTAISLLSESARRRVSADNESKQDIEHSLQNIGIQAKRISKMIRGLQRFSTENTLQTETVSIECMVREVIELIDAEARLNNVNILIDLEKGLELEIDKILIEQVFINLIRNAIDALKDISAENRKIFIYAGRLNDEVIVSIKDNGPGMTSDQAEHAFDTFYTSKPDGVGMGLVISRDIIKAHGGDIRFCTSPSEGCTFYLTLGTEKKEVKYYER